MSNLERDWIEDIKEESEYHLLTCENCGNEFRGLGHRGTCRLCSESLFRHHFRTMQRSVNRTAKEKGWWEKNRSPAECIALIHSELSECLEAFREGDPPSEKPDMLGVTCAEEELADVVIRVMDFAQQFELNIADAITAKANYNKTRPYKHGGKKF